MGVYSMSPHLCMQMTETLSPFSVLVIVGYVSGVHY